MIDGSGKFLKKKAKVVSFTAYFLIQAIRSCETLSKIKGFSKYHLGFLDENINHEVDVLAGAFMLIPKKFSTLREPLMKAFYVWRRH